MLKIKFKKETLTKYALTALLCAVVAAVLVLSAERFIKFMNFANPAFLYGLLPLILLLACAAALKKFYTPSVKFPFLQDFTFKSGFFGAFVKWTPFVLCCAALVLGVIALARPRLAGKTVVPPAKGIDIMMTIDTSGSMEAVDFDPNRMEAAKATAQDFVDKRTSDRIGIVVFAQIAMLQCPLTLDYDSIHEYVDNISINMLGGSGGTAIGDAIAVSTEHLKESRTKSKIVILITDGESNSGTVDPVVAAKAAASYGIKVYTIAISGDAASQAETLFGRPFYAGNNPNMPTGDDLLKQVADTTGAKFYRAKNNEELAGIYEQINNLEKTEFEHIAEVNYKDNYAGLLSAAIVLLLLAFITRKFLFIRIP